MVINISLDTNNAISDHIKSFATTFSSIQNFFISNYAKGEKNKVILEIPIGEYDITYNDIDIHLSYKEIGEPVGTAYGSVLHNNLIISTNKGSKDDLLKFIYDARDFYKKKPDKHVICKILNNSYWSILSKLPKRNLDTIYLDKNIKENVIEDLEFFFDNEQLYLDYGIPYKRCYLLEGVPGTGKTSLIFSVASKYNLDVCIVNMTSSIDDKNFMTAISNLDDNTILLLEDVDSLFTEQTNISFSGMLNILDGIGRKHKLVIFLTTNHKDKLDPVMIRPGRIDYEVNFTYSTKYQIRSMLDKLLPQYKDEFDSFIKKIKGKKLTTAILQKFFFECKKNNKGIMNNIDLIDVFIQNYNNNNNLYL